eukprot:629310-Pleurochrysis_carterae.AAC.1
MHALSPPPVNLERTKPGKKKMYVRNKKQTRKTLKQSESLEIAEGEGELRREKDEGRRERARE